MNNIQEYTARLNEATKGFSTDEKLAFLAGMTFAHEEDRRQQSLNN